MPTQREYQLLQAALDSAFMAFKYENGATSGEVDVMTLAQWLARKAGRRDDWPLGKVCEHCNRGRNFLPR